MWKNKQKHRGRLYAFICHTTNNLNIKYTRIFLVFFSVDYPTETQTSERGRKQTNSFRITAFLQFLHPYWGKTSGLTLSSPTKRRKTLQCSQVTKKVWRIFPFSLTMQLHSTLTPHASPSSPTLSSSTISTHPTLQATRCILVLLSSTHVCCPQVAGC